MDQTVGTPDIQKISDTHFMVESFTQKEKYYHVTKRGKYWYCNCPRSVFGKTTCHHIRKVGEI
jgi:hypothetical protein